MAPYTRGVQRSILRFVRINSTFIYGWKSKDIAAIAQGITEADLRTSLGHLTAQQADAVPNRLMVVGSNTPKPPRVGYNLPNPTVATQDKISTFCAYNAIATANTAGWDLIAPAKKVSLSSLAAGRRSVTAVAQLSNGILYAFPLNRTDFEAWAPALGLQSSTTVSTQAERDRLMTGKSKTRPGRAISPQGGGVGGTFFSTDAAAAAAFATGGWSILSEEVIEYPAAAAPPPATP